MNEPENGRDNVDPQVPLSPGTEIATGDRTHPEEREISVAEGESIGGDDRSAESHEPQGREYEDHEGAATYEQVKSLEHRIAEMNEGFETVQQVKEAVSRLPPKLIQLSRDISRATDAVGHSKFKSFLLEVLRFREMLEQGVEELNGSLGADSTASRISRNLLHQLDQTLRVYDITEVEVARGSSFDAEQLMAVERSSTQDARLDGTVKEVLRRGYQLGDSVLTVPQVSVYSFNPDKPSSEPDGGGHVA
ncbi:MAG: nucleotide exchange factor GrpE [Myxococcota bacterium]